jgi:hypothetical protein
MALITLDICMQAIVHMYLGLSSFHYICGLAFDAAVSNSALSVQQQSVFELCPMPFQNIIPAAAPQVQC